jgi:2-polyprenyl-3-methyl-5-hydroxy-6-metoxy-1,4-benzoquinol methylase
MKHSQSDAFDRALSTTPSPAARWSDVADDPNDPRVLVQRARTLRAAWRPEIADRAEFIVDRCRGRRVLDIGCVAHDVERMRSPQWLHGRIAAVAATCLGVDVLPVGVEQMRREGFDAVAHDLSTGPGPVAGHGPFDVIVAGEIIEHVPSLDMLFTAARELLAVDGQLVITTPNPWAPHRVRAGQRGDCWENVDHIMFAFPSGVAELAERHGLVLAEAATTSADRYRPHGPLELARAVRRRIRGTGWVRAGFATQGAEGAVRITGRPGMHARKRGHGIRFVGETFVYVVRRPGASVSA